MIHQITSPRLPATRLLPTETIKVNPFSISIYGDSETETGDLLESIRSHGVLVPLVVTRQGDGWQLLSGHRRLTCARKLRLRELPCQIRGLPGEVACQQAVIEYNRQRRKTFSQLMREADVLENVYSRQALQRRLGNLRGSEHSTDHGDRRNSDDRAGRTDELVAGMLNMGGKDLYRQARAIWRKAQEGDVRALGSVSQLDGGGKTIYAAYKDLRRRDRFTTGFRPTPYDVWSFRQDRAFGLSHPGAIPAAIIAHALYYFTRADDLVVDPMAGGGTTLDVCLSMGRRCLAYDIHPTRPEIQPLDIQAGLPQAALGCALIFADPPYHTMLSGRYARPGVGDQPLATWQKFLTDFSVEAYSCLRSGGHIMLLLANQTEKDLPAGYGYIDHAFLGYQALTGVGFVPVRRISCPMDGSYLPQHIQLARREGRMLGQVRDLLVMRKPGGS
jgi:hypothetical protein